MHGDWNRMLLYALASELKIGFLLEDGDRSDIRFRPVLTLDAYLQ